MSDTIAQATELIKSRLEEIDGERRALERALKQLDGKAPQARRAATTRGRKIAPRGERRRQLLEVIERRPGIRPAEAAREIGISPNHVYMLVRTLRDRGEVVSDEQGLRLAKPAPSQGSEEDEEKTAA